MQLVLFSKDIFGADSGTVSNYRVLPEASEKQDITT